MTEQPAVPLDHRARRRILRRLHEEGSDTSTAAELAADLRLKVNEVLYHAQVLVKYEKLVECRRGTNPSDTQFKSMVADDPEVVSLLISTELEDERQ